MRVGLQAYKDGFKNSVGVVLMLLVIFGVVWFVEYATLQAWIIRAGIWAPAVFVLAKASTLVFAPISGGPLYPLAGALFGFNVGFVLLLLGDALGSAIAFLISRRLGRASVERMVKNEMGVVAKVRAVLTTTKGFVVARVCLASLPEVVAYAAGLTPIGFLKFFVIQNAVGVLPTAFFCFGGSALVVLRSPAALVATSVGGLLAAGVGVTLFGWWVRRSTLTH
ncbi:MAG: VTT domain-containing protein [Patescibacteria group bacterium]